MTNEQFAEQLSKLTPEQLKILIQAAMILLELFVKKNG